MSQGPESPAVVARSLSRMWWLIPIGLVLAALFTFGTGLTSCDIIDGAGLNASVACLGIDPSLSASGTATTYPKDFNQLSFVTNSAKLANDAAQENTKYRSLAHAFDTLANATRHGRQADIAAATRKARQACAPLLPKSN